MPLPTDGWPPALLRALAEYAPTRAMEAAVRHAPGLQIPESTLVMLAGWIHGGCELIQVSAEAVLEIGRFAPMLSDAIALPSDIVGVQLERLGKSGETALFLLRPMGDRLAISTWDRGADGRWHVAQDGVQTLSMLDLALGTHPLFRGPQVLRIAVNGLVVGRTQAPLTATPLRPQKRHGRRSAPSTLPPARRLLLDVSAVYTWRRERAGRLTPPTPPQARAEPTAARGIHHVAEHRRRVRVRVEGCAELVTEWRPIVAHARGSGALLVRRDRVTTGVGDLRTA